MLNQGNKKTILVLVIILILIVINSDRIYNLFQEKITPEKINVNGKTFSLEIADTKEKMERGLSGRASLATNTGLLFIFDKPGIYSFWMKEMNFPIDIIWLDKNKKILGTTKNLLPNSYPQIFYSPTSTSYALEINAESN
jgi:hypothetical protein